ncbi:MAG: oligopeptide transport system substrate-binding protein [Phycisphaerales bacterium]|jgi:oligopeptide transport system substrate-binding protein
MARLLIPFILLIVLVGASVATDRPLPRADLVMYNGSDVNTLDPQRMTWMPDLRVARAIFEGLVHNDVFTQGFDLSPGVAERWEVSPDGLTYTFHLRPDAMWSNGERVTAEHFRYAWRRAMLPDMASKYFDFLMYIDGAQAFYDWRKNQLDLMAQGKGPFADGDALWAATLKKFDTTVKVNAPDNQTLIVRLAQPVPHFLDLCAFTTFFPVYPPLVDQYERPSPTTGALQRRTGWTKPGVLVSNGAFTLQRWRFKREMRLAKNPFYWDADHIALDSISIPSIGDPNAAILAYETGAVDFMAEVTASYRGDMIAAKQRFYDEHTEQIEEMRSLGLDQFEIDRRLPDDPRKNVHAVPAFGTYFYNFNCRPELGDGRPNPFADARVRRAFAMVVDKGAIVREVRRVGDATASTLIPPGSIGGYTAPNGLRCISDATTEAQRQEIIDEARALLAQAGYANPSEDFPLTVEMLFNKDSGHDLIAQVIAKNWSKHLGVKVRLAQKELKIFREDLRLKNYMTARAGWYGDYGDPTTFLDLNKTDNGNNDRAFSSLEYDSLLRRAQGERDPEKRMKVLEEAERFLVEEAVPLIPIFHYSTVYMFDPDEITGLSTHPRTKQQIWLIDRLGDGKGPDTPRPMAASRPGIETLDQLEGSP